MPLCQPSPDYLAACALTGMLMVTMLAAQPTMAQKAGAAVTYTKKETTISPGLNIQEVQRLPVPPAIPVPVPVPVSVSVPGSGSGSGSGSVAGTVATSMSAQGALPQPLTPPDPASLPLHYWIVKGSIKQGWTLKLGLADGHNIVKKRSVRLQAAALEAPVVVNGGFFAYGGGAVGAVRKDGEWQRAAWKNRTALGWSILGKKRIGNLATTVRVELGKTALDGVTLNGLTTAYSYARDNGFALMTSFSVPSVSLPQNCAALAVQNGRVVARYAAVPPGPPPGQAPLLQPPAVGSTLAQPGTLLPATGAPQSAPAPVPGPTGGPAPQTVATIPQYGWLLVALTPANNAALDVPEGTPATWGMQNSPAAWSDIPNILGAGPRLVARGKVRTTEKAEEFRPDVLARGPRTAVGWDKNGNWMLLVVDGRQALSAGLTLAECADLLRRNGAVEAMNLDGGSSTQLVVGGQLTNRPSAIDVADPTKQREVQVPNVLYFSQMLPAH